MNSVTKPRVFAFICVIIWSFISIIAKIGQQSLNFYQFLFFSNIISLITVILASLSAGRSFFQIFIIRPSVAGGAMCLGVLDCLFYLAIYRGYSLENGIAVLIVQYSWPIMTVILSSIRDSKWPNHKKIFGLTIGMIAIITTLTKGNITNINIANPIGIIIVLAGAFCFALLSTLSKIFVSDKFVGTVWIFLSSTIISFFLVSYFSSFQLYTSTNIFVILLNGIFINGLSYILWVTACTEGDATEIASLVFLSPVLSAIWLVSFFHEAFVPAYAVALTLVLVSGIMCIGGRRSQVTKSKCNRI